MDWLEVRLDPKSDRTGRDLKDYLAAHFALENAAARRVFLVHMTSILGLSLFLCSTCSVPRAVRNTCLGVFAGVATVLAGSIVDELRCRRAVKRAEQGVDIVSGKRA